MRPLMPVTGGLAAVALLIAAAATAQPAFDPMAALPDAPAYDALLGQTPESGTESSPAATPPAAVFDPMAAAARPQDPAAGEADTDQAAPVNGPPDPELGNLPAGPGAEATYYQCVACHSTALIRQQRITDARWDYLWHWMVEEQGMIEPDAETKELILSYLKRNFSSER